MGFLFSGCNVCRREAGAGVDDFQDVMYVDGRQEPESTIFRDVMDKPFSPACERNKDPILKVLQEYITKNHSSLLEVGSGTGQHAVYFAPHFPHLEWVPSDVKANHAGMMKWFNEYRLPNITKPIPFEIGKDDFPKLKFETVFTANTFHIMHWKEVKTLIKMLGHRLREDALAMIYGPFNYGGQFTSASNEEFDKSLKAKDPLSGIRSFEDVNANMIKNGFELLEDVEMPANNRMLIYRRLKFIPDR